MYSCDDNSLTYSRATTDMGHALGLVRKGRDLRRSENVPSDELWSVDGHASEEATIAATPDNNWVRVLVTVLVFFLFSFFFRFFRFPIQKPRPAGVSHRLK